MSETTRKRRQTLAGMAVILFAAAVALAPIAVRRDNSCGHDFDFHLLSWLDAQQAWRHGILYPHWAPTPNFSAGEPRFVFYPPLTWMLGALLGAVLPWKLVAGALTYLVLAATGLATRALAREALDEGPATLAACAAIFSRYALFTTYERSAFAELTGGFWIPLLLLFALRDRSPAKSVLRRAFDGSAAPLALVLAGAWLSNAPVGVMASYVLAAVALACAITAKSWAPILRASVAAGLGLGAAAVYLVPAAWEQRWIDIRQATADAGLLIENSWLFGRHASPQLEAHDIELLKVSFIAVMMLGVALASILTGWLRKSLPRPGGSTGGRWWIPLALIPVAILVLQLPVSLPLWNLLPKMRFLQFPWRWLVVLEAPMAIFFAAAVWSFRRRARVAALALCGIYFVGTTALAGLTFFQLCDADDSVNGMMDMYHSGAGYEGTGEYAPPGADNTLIATGLPGACLVTDPAAELGEGDADTTPAWYEEQGSCDDTFDLEAVRGKDHVEHFKVDAETDHPGYLVLRLRSYPAWQVKVNGQIAGALPVREDGLTAVPVPPGLVTVTIDWTTTQDVVAGRWLSAAALLMVTLLWLMERRLNRPRLS